jgi:hypothetical protein
MNYDNMTDQQINEACAKTVLKWVRCVEVPTILCSNPERPCGACQAYNIERKNNFLEGIPEYTSGHNCFNDLFASLTPEEQWAAIEIHAGTRDGPWCDPSEPVAFWQLAPLRDKCIAVLKAMGVEG